MAGAALDAFVFFFNDTATTEIYTLSLHDALPILMCSTSERAGVGFLLMYSSLSRRRAGSAAAHAANRGRPSRPDRKSTRLNSSHANISYAVFCLKKKNTSSP